MSRKKLARSRDEKWVAGVCGGLAEYTGVDVNLVRLLVAVTTVLGAGSVALAYLVAWVVMPKQEPAGWSAPPLGPTAP